MTNVTNRITDLKIRPMIATDLDEITALEEAVFPDPWSRSMFEEQLNGENWGGFVAEYEGLTVGYACYYIAVTEGHLTNIATRPEFRRKSVAKQLLDNILRVGQENECEFMLLEVRPSNTAAITFYKKYGFDLLYRRPDYYHNPVEDALVLVRYYDENEEF